MKIKHAAAKSECGWTFIGETHAKCMAKMANINLDVSTSPEDQGFITEMGEFVNRQDAASIAYENGQIEKPTLRLSSEKILETHFYDNLLGYMTKNESSDANFVNKL